MKQHINIEEWRKQKCENIGHDWAFQDEDTYMVKTCLRCGATQLFFPEEVDE